MTYLLNQKIVYFQWIVLLKTNDSHNYRYGMGQMAPGPNCAPNQGLQVPEAEEAEEDDDDPQIPHTDKSETKNKRQLELIEKL